MQCYNEIKEGEELFMFRLENHPSVSQGSKLDKKTNQMFRWFKIRLRNHIIVAMELRLGYQKLSKCFERLKLKLL